ncbi:MAG: TPM domain-containing protein [Rubrivivax sp.]|nr:MAG: TPM domain-containing protein [Rubrivivax sp.]
MDEGDVHRQLGKAGLARLHAQVSASETRHLGELRLCIEGGLGWQDLLQKQTARTRALHLFSTLRVWDTEHNNGVLIYLLLADRRIEILADRGIMARVGPEPWAHIAHELATRLRHGQFEQGLSHSIEAVTQLLSLHFPATSDKDNPNELPDQVVVI